MMRIASTALAVAASGAAAQHAIPWSSLDSGATVSAGDHFTLAGTIAQQDAGPVDGEMSGHFYQLSGGFWQPPVAEFETGCNLADIAEPFGLLDLTDINTFVVAFVTSDPIADIAEPFGFFDLADLVLFINEFTAGCP